MTTVRILLPTSITNTITSQSGLSCSFVFAAQAPGVPTNVVATASGDRQATVSFVSPSNNGGSPITGYNIYMNTYQQGNALTVSSLTNIGTSYTAIINNLTPGQTYSFIVEAVNIVGGNINPAQNQSLPITIVSKPYEPVAIANLNGNVINLSLSVPTAGTVGAGYSTITGYTITGQGTITNNLLSSGSATISNLTLGNFYSFVVTVVNSSGLSNTSTTSGIQYLTAPEAPIVTSSANAGMNSITLTLTPATTQTSGYTPITGYTIVRNSTNYYFTNNQCTIGNLTIGQTYSYIITAINRIGSTSRTVTAIPTSLSPSPPNCKVTYANNYITITLIPPIFPTETGGYPASSLSYVISDPHPLIRNGMLISANTGPYPPFYTNGVWTGTQTIPTLAGEFSLYKVTV